MISLANYKKLKSPKLFQSSLNLSSPGGNLNTLGEFMAQTTYKEQKYSFKIVVVDQLLNRNLLSRAVSSKLGLVKRIDSISKVFGSTGLAKTKPVKIKLLESAKPNNIVTPRWIPFPLADAIKQELGPMEQNGIIQKSAEPTDWCSPWYLLGKRIDPSESVLTSSNLMQLSRGHTAC